MITTLDWIGLAEYLISFLILQFVWTINHETINLSEHLIKGQKEINKKENK